MAEVQIQRSPSLRAVKPLHILSDASRFQPGGTYAGTPVPCPGERMLDLQQSKIMIEAPSPQATFLPGSERYKATSKGVKASSMGLTLRKTLPTPLMADPLSGSRSGIQTVCTRHRGGLFFALPCSLLVLGACAAVSAQAQSARTWNSRGQNAELKEDYDNAYEDYRQAHLKSPKDLRYVERVARLRFQAAVQHVDRGRLLRQSGDITGALGQFTRALEIDPGNQAAAQEITATQQQERDNLAGPRGTATNGTSIVGAGSSVTGTGAPDPTMPITRHPGTLEEIGSIASPVELRPMSNDPVTIHSVEDVKAIYQAIGKAAGLNVLFDPDYSSKRIPVDLTAVSLSDALRIVGTIAGTFYKPITPNTIFVAQNTRTKRTDLDELAVQTFYLTNASQANDANEIITAVRNLLDPSVKVYLVPSQNAIVMRATTDQLILAEKLLNDLDRVRPEVVVDVAVLQVSRDKIRNLGITLPQSFGLTPTSTTSTAANGTTGNTANTGSTTSTTSSLTLNSLAHLNASNFNVSITGGTLNALLSDSDTRVLQNPRIRATDGQRATLKIGSKIPIATGSYNAGVSTGVASIGVQTQFTYLDIGVNIDITPTVHLDREISLKLKIEISSQVNSVVISGVNEPIIAQDTSEQVIQLAEGEPTILAGIIQRQDNNVNSGTPGLAEVPLLKYFFGSQNIEHQKSEVVFLLIPHIVRESVLTKLNTAVIDTGTGQAVELRRTATQGFDPDAPANPAFLPRPHQANETSAANAAAAAVQQLRQQAAPPTPPQPGITAASAAAAAVTPPSASPTPAAAGSAQPVTLTVTPASTQQTVGGNFQVVVTAANARDLYAVPLQLQFNSKMLSLVNVDAGDLLGRDGQAVSIVHRDDQNGTVTISTSRPPNVAGVSGQGSIAILTFKATAAGDSNLSLIKVGAKDSAQANLAVIGSQATVHVQ